MGYTFLCLKKVNKINMLRLPNNFLRIGVESDDE